MTRAPHRSVVRLGALVGVAGALGLTACTPDSSTGAAGGGEEFADGTYSADGSYSTPETVETILVTVTLADGVITHVDVEGTPQRPESEQFQAEFIGGIADEVVGKPIDDLAVSRVAGSSLTSGGFNQAIERIRVQASEAAD